MNLNTEKSRINYVIETRLKNTEAYMDSFSRTFDTEIREVLKLKKRLDPEMIQQVIRLILNCRGRVVITGMGKSGIIGRKISSTLASTGTPSFFLHPAEGLHGDLGRITRNDIVLAISNSGETQEVLRILPSVRRIGAKVVSITGNARSTLAGLSNLSIDTGTIAEACPLGLAPTSTTTATLILGDALAVALLDVRDFKPEDFAVFHPGGSLGRKLLLTVKGVIRSINRANPAAYQNAKVKEVLFKMTESGIGAVSIVNEENRLIGILTDGDIRKALSNGNISWDQPIRQIYTADPYFVTTDQLAAEALHLMEEKDIHVLPIVKSGENEPIAIIRIQDLTRIGL